MPRLFQPPSQYGVPPGLAAQVHQAVTDLLRANTPSVHWGVRVANHPLVLAQPMHLRTATRTMMFVNLYQRSEMLRQFPYQGEDVIPLGAPAWTNRYVQNQPFAAPDQAALYPTVPQFQRVFQGRVGTYDNYEITIRPNNHTIAMNLRMLILHLQHFVQRHPPYAASYQARRYVLRFLNTVSTRWTQVHRLTWDELEDTETLLQEIETLLHNMTNSDDELEFFDLRVEFDVSEAAAGGSGGGEDVSMQNEAEEDVLALPVHLAHFRGLKHVPEKHGLCGFMALAYLVTESKVRKSWTRRLTVWRKAARDLKRRMGLEERDEKEGMTMEDLTAFVRLHPDKRVVVFDLVAGVPTPTHVTEGASFTLEGLQPSENPEQRCLYLLFDRKAAHFSIINNVSSFTDPVKKHQSRKHLFCHGCLMVFRDGTTSTKKCLDIKRHECKVLKCEPCNHYFRTQEELDAHQTLGSFNDSHCRRCNLLCKNPTCRDMHELKCRSPVKACLECLWMAPIDKHGNYKEEHVCHARKCRNCGTLLKTEAEMVEHVCYLRPLLPPKHVFTREAGEAFFCFDMESMLVPTGKDGVEKHVVNLVVVQQCFLPQNRWVFRSLEAFVTFLASSPRAGTVFIAHNLKGYDGRLLYDYLVKEMGESPGKQMWIGQKIVSFSFRGAVFRDSLLHISDRLENFPKIFGLDATRYKKDYFPYKFNIPEHQSYVGPVPALKWYEVDRMSKEKRKAFLAWHASQSAVTDWDLQKEMLTYCESDVDLLARSMEVYMEESAALNGGLNPMDSLTIASYALRVYRTFHMPPDTVAVLKPEWAAFARKCLRGGRTDARVLYKRWSPERVFDPETPEYGRYVDIQSMYPTAQFYDPMPVGIPRVFREGDAEMPSLETFIGFACVDVTPTRYLHHPVLVSTDPQTGKLTADLHPKERLYVTSVELQLALKHGYRVDRVHELHAYTPCTDLFKSYVRHFLSIKITCSAPPVNTLAAWREHVDRVQTTLGIENLDRDRLPVLNAGRRAIAKLMLNSLWGKLGQRDNLVQFKTCRTPAEYMRLDRMEVDGEIVMTYRERTKKGQIIVGYHASSPEQNLRKTNVAVACFVSAGGRVRLTEEMQRLKERVLYHDTDSIVYAHDPWGYNVPEGDLLGEWEDEMKGQRIGEFVALGPKTYSLTYYSHPQSLETLDLVTLRKEGREVVAVDGTSDQYRVENQKCKAKGFTLNHHNAQRINTDAMKQQLFGFRDHVPAVVTENLRFCYDRRKGGIFTKIEHKLFKYAYDKGLVTEDFRVFPHGTELFLEAAERMGPLLKRRFRKPADVSDLLINATLLPCA